MTPPYDISDKDMKLLQELYGHLDDFDCGWLYNFGADAMAALERLTAGENLTPISPRPPVTDLRHEPPYPDHETAVVSLHSPMTVHEPTELCSQQGPHLLGRCKEFTGGA